MKQPCENDNLETFAEENNRKIRVKSNGIKSEENNHNMESLKNNDKKELAIIEGLEISPENKCNMVASSIVSKTDLSKQKQDATSHV